MFPLRVLIVDSNIGFLESAAHLLQLQPCVQFVSYAVSASDALDQVPLFNPNLVLVSWNLVDSTGLLLTQTLKQGPHPPRVVILSLIDLPIYHTVAKQAGADALICTIDWSDQLFKLLTAFDQPTVNLAVPAVPSPFEQTDQVKR